MKIAVCEDDRVQCEYLAKCILAYDSQIMVSSYAGSDVLWWDIQDGKVFDLLFLDIEMPHMNGMQLAHNLRDHNLNIPVCFVTGVKEYVFEGYEVEACGYLLKPYEKDQVFRILDKVKNRMPETEKWITIEQKSQIIRIRTKEIVAIEACGHDITIYMKNGNNQTVHKSFQQMLSEMDELTQIHRSYAVNLHNIESIQRNECCDKRGRQFPISKRLKDEVVHKFIVFNRGTV